MGEHTVTDVARHFAEYVDRVAYRGEHIRLLKGGRPVADLVPVPAGRRLRELPALLDSLPRLGEEEADALARDLADAGEALAGAEVRDPWLS